MQSELDIESGAVGTDALDLDAYPINERWRLAGKALEVADERILPHIGIKGNKRTDKWVYASCLLANLLYRYQQGRIVRCCRSAGIPNYRIKRQVLEQLLCLDLVGIIKEGYYDASIKKGRETRIGPTDKCLAVFSEYLTNESFVEMAPSDVINMKGKLKEVITDLSVFSPEDLSILDLRREQIHQINAVNRKHRCIYRIWNPRSNKLGLDNARAFTDLIATYNNASVYEGGRLYGDFQNIRREERKSLTIDSIPTVELDYSCLHPSMLYHKKGLKAPKDAYAIAGNVDRSLRKAIKTAFNALINAKDKKTAILGCNFELRAYPITRNWY